MKRHSSFIPLSREHQEMRKIVEFLRHPPQQKLESTLTQFGALLEKHIHSEEREFFPMCERSIPSEQLYELGVKIRNFPSETKS